MQALFDLTGKTALVTGASKGIGNAIACGFAQAGADLFLCSRTKETLDAAADHIRKSYGVRVVCEAADMAKREDIDRLVDRANEAFGHIDILVNNAGWNVPQSIDAIKDEDWQYLVDLNLTNVMVLTRALVPGMKARGWGRVIHISSIMALASTPARNAYSATKAALVAMAKASALDLGSYGITVNCIAPGPVATEMPMSILSQTQQDALAAKTAVGRWGTPDEMVAPALMLAGEGGRFVTGTCIVVDGGALARIF